MRRPERQTSHERGSVQDRPPGDVRRYGLRSRDRRDRPKAQAPSGDKLPGGRVVRLLSSHDPPSGGRTRGQSTPPSPSSQIRLGLPGDSAGRSQKCPRIWRPRGARQHGLVALRRPTNRLPRFAEHRGAARRGTSPHRGGHDGRRRDARPARRGRETWLGRRDVAGGDRPALTRLAEPRSRAATASPPPGV
jgi:hypothetical protein